MLLVLLLPVLMMITLIMTMIVAMAALGGQTSKSVRRGLYPDRLDSPAVRRLCAQEFKEHAGGEVNDFQLCRTSGETRQGISPNATFSTIAESRDISEIRSPAHSPAAENTITGISKVTSAWKFHGGRGQAHPADGLERAGRMAARKHGAAQQIAARSRRPVTRIAHEPCSGSFFMQITVADSLFIV
jgi:hypothetical protein